MVVLLIITLAVTGDGRAKAEGQLDKVKHEIEKLQKENEKLNKELIVKNETLKTEPILVQPARSEPVRSVFSSGSCEQYRPLVVQYAWNVETAMRVMDYESGGGLDGNCDPNAANRTDHHYNSSGGLICIGSFGLFQISCHSGEVYDPAQNVALAWGKYQYGGWYQPWRNTCNKIGCTL